MKLKILGLTVPVVVKKLDGKHDGFFMSDTRQILVDKDLTAEERLDTVVHEAVHAVLYRTGLTQVINEHVEEVLCETMSVFIRENFDFKS